MCKPKILKTDSKIYGMTPFRCPDQPHLLVHHDDTIAPNPVTFPMHSGPIRNIKTTMIPSGP